jgi:hypothetical protein
MILKVSKKIDIINQDLIAISVNEIEWYITGLYGNPVNKNQLLEEDLSMISVIFEYDYVDTSLIEGYIYGTE